MTTDVLNHLGDKYIPLPIEAFFTPRRSLDGFWCADEMPPTIQDAFNNPYVVQSRAMLGLTIIQRLQQSMMQREAQREAQRSRPRARSRRGPKHR
jgi:hypothetical protein